MQLPVRYLLLAVCVKTTKKSAGTQLSVGTDMDLDLITFLYNNVYECCLLIIEGTIWTSILSIYMLVFKDHKYHQSQYYVSTVLHSGFWFFHVSVNI
jgi:hypothetical protein